MSAHTSIYHLYLVWIGRAVGDGHTERGSYSILHSELIWELSALRFLISPERDRFNSRYYIHIIELDVLYQYIIHRVTVSEGRKIAHISGGCGARSGPFF